FSSEHVLHERAHARLILHDQNAAGSRTHVCSPSEGSLRGMLAGRNWLDAHQQQVSFPAAARGRLTCRTVIRIGSLSRKQAHWSQNTRRMGTSAASDETRQWLPIHGNRLARLRHREAVIPSPFGGHG